ncbi:MAG TPA: MFS transporter [Chryseosolibacter sp.]|nr:MFS transporter [Chryseosolibacter sp.]
MMRDSLSSGKATRINLLDFKSVPMRTFHITWFTFFVCFFGWFGIAPLMPVVREDLGLSQGQIGYIIIGSVSITIFARLLFGWLCDKIGPRISYTILLITAALPVAGIGFSNSYEMFLLFRLAIGITGASFVITQYHTSVMFSSNVVGTANATAAGWGNMGGGITLMVMPFVFAGFVALGYVDPVAWRLSMIVPGVALMVMAFVYYFFTQDNPEGNIRSQRLTASENAPAEKLTSVCRDYRVWVLFLAYGACFGIEITIDNIAMLYFIDTFHLGLREAGLIAGTFGLMNIFARALGGIAGDRAGRKYGLKGRMLVLALFLLMEGLGIILFGRMDMLPWAIVTMLVFALFLKMSNGATYSVVPFINSRSMGVVSGIVGAGGNVGAVLAGFLFTSETASYQDNFFVIGLAVTAVSVLSFIMTFSRKAIPETVHEHVGAGLVLKEAIA